MRVQNKEVQRKIRAFELERKELETKNLNMQTETE